jgi:predicted XRE-type DNA-binding protein
MPSINPKNRPGHVTKGDIFDDLGFSPREAAEAKIKADLWRELLAHMESQGITQVNLAAALRVHQPDISNLYRGKLSKFSVSKLIHFAVSLNIGVQVKLTSPKKAKTVFLKASSAKATKKERQLVNA